jgi:hypothetical protein
MHCSNSDNSFSRSTEIIYTGRAAGFDAAVAPFHYTTGGPARRGAADFRKMEKASPDEGTGFIPRVRSRSIATS